MCCFLGCLHLDIWHVCSSSSLSEEIISLLDMILVHGSVSRAFPPASGVLAAQAVLRISDWPRPYLFSGASWSIGVDHSESIRLACYQPPCFYWSGK